MNTLTQHIAPQREDPRVHPLVERVRLAVAKREPLRLRGQDSKSFYGRPVAGSPVPTHHFSGIVDFEPTELVVTARAGTPIAELERALAERGQMLACEPPRFAGGGTVGGATATGLSGPRRAYAGALRDFVLGVRIVDGQGRLLRFGGRVIKNVAGFDVARLMVGAQGTLGLITEVTFKTQPLPAATCTLVREADEDSALHAFNAWRGRPLPVSATCHWQGRMYVRLCGAEAAVREARRTLGGEELAQAAAFWQGLRDQDHAFFQGAQELWRVGLPATAPSLGLPLPQLIEWSGAQRWLAGPVDAGPLRERLARAGGHLTRFRAPGDAAGPFQPLPAPLLALHRRLKGVFDPSGLLNRGRLYPTL